MEQDVWIESETDWRICHAGYCEGMKTVSPIAVTNFFSRGSHCWKIPPHTGTSHFSVYENMNSHDKWPGDPCPGFLVVVLLRPRTILQVCNAVFVHKNKFTLTCVVLNVVCWSETDRMTDSVSRITLASTHIKELSLVPIGRISKNIYVELKWSFSFQLKADEIFERYSADESPGSNLVETSELLQKCSDVCADMDTLQLVVMQLVREKRAVVAVTEKNQQASVLCHVSSFSVNKKSNTNVRTFEKQTSCCEAKPFFAGCKFCNWKQNWCRSSHWTWIENDAASKNWTIFAESNTAAVGWHDKVCELMLVWKVSSLLCFAWRAQNESTGDYEIQCFADVRTTPGSTSEKDWRIL